MKRTILTVIALAALSITAVQAQQTIPVSPTPQPGAPGTATPTPYPQITPINIPKSGAGSGSPPLVPIEMTTPPSHVQAVPGIEPSGSKAKSPGG